MAITKYDLDINKQAIMKPVVILRQGDYGIDTMQVSLSVANEAMDLTGATIKFMGTTAGGKQIIDDAHVKIIDAKGGVFEYVFPSEAASDIGGYRLAYFSIIQANGQSSTMDFRVQVLSGVDISAPVASEYIAHYDTMVAKLNSAYDSATNATNQKMASTVSSLATSAATVLDSALARVNDVNSTANSASSAASKAVSMASSVASTVTSQASYINSVASSAASNVSSVAASVVDKLNNISVGGRNYILNSSGLSLTDSNRPVLNGAISNVVALLTYSADGVKISNNQGTKEFFYEFARTWTDITKTPLVAGNTYTLSVKARGTAPQIALRVGYQNMNPAESVGYTQLDSTKWTKATFTFTIPVAASNIFLRINGGINNHYSGFAGNETIEFKEVMLEQSNVASDWSPAPEDVVQKSGDTMTGNLMAPQVIATDVLTGFHNVIQVPDTTTKIIDLINNDFIKGRGLWKEATFIAFNRVLSDAPTNDVYSIIKLATRGSNRTYVEYSDLSGNVWHTTATTNTLNPWVKQANDSEVLHKTGNETVAGDKTLTGNTTLANIKSSNVKTGSVKLGGLTINFRETAVGVNVYMDGSWQGSFGMGDGYVDSGSIPTSISNPRQNVVLTIIGNGGVGGVTINSPFKLEVLITTDGKIKYRSKSLRDNDTASHTATIIGADSTFYALD